MVVHLEQKFGIKRPGIKDEIRDDAEMSKTMIKCLQANFLPKADEKCEYCKYAEAVMMAMGKLTDSIYTQAKEFVQGRNTISAKDLMEKFKITYMRAARILAMLEADDSIAPYEGSLDRKVRH